MGKFTTLLCAVLVVFLVACAGETETDEEQSPPETAVTLEPPTSTHAPPTATSEPPTDTSVPPTLNAMEVAMTEQALTMEVATPIPSSTPAPTSCNEVEGVCLWASFDGTNCTFEGPAAIEPGHVTLLFLNDSEALNYVNITRHTRGKTVQDMIDYTEQELRIGEYHPAWAELLDAYGGAHPGNIYTWEGVLKPGIHTIVCLTLLETGYDLTFGAGVTVE